MDAAAGNTAEVVQRLRSARRLAALTGAGISAESGIPTFRGKDGLWKDRRAEQLATPQALHHEREIVWEWYHWRRNLVRAASPNLGHLALVAMEGKVPGFKLITQNVDGLHTTAGNLSVIELHGSIHRARCFACRSLMALTEETGVPVCASCGSDMRPDVVLFGESLDMGILQEAVKAASSSDLFIVAGTSSVVQPAASLAEIAARSGAFVLEVNLEPTPLTGTADATLLGRTGEVLPMLMEAVWGK